jgi:membrane protein insertase Oxa1/YidC/SpoIIIJ/rhodanese-related sulfurtransferase/phosphohistidine swiveling domain-containing protein
MRCVSSGGRTALVAGALAACFMEAGPALAIPSPELIVGSFTSISQLVALVSALVGGGAAAVTLRARNGGGRKSYPLAIATGLAVLLTVSAGLNVYQYVDQKNQRQERLEETLLRPARAAGGLPMDPEIKELNFAQQLRHPRQMSTEEADKLLEALNSGERNDVIFLDVRERAERETGTLPGVTFVRYPDLSTANIDFTGKKAILFCHNGNRSHETCEALLRQGIDCQFIAGGLEKWVVERRSMSGMSVRSIAELRAIPPYPNRNTLLDTKEVRRLVRDERAIFIDARYPFDFANHPRLPDAINLTIRRIPTAELERLIEQLPRRPMILPCYDRRGCFFSEVLGLELSRAGHDVRGRYTMPWEYFVQPGRPPHVQKWIEEQQQSVWVNAGRRLSEVLSWTANWIGLPLAILLLAIVSRLLVLPFSVKAERDQIRSHALAGELASLKARLRNDPGRRARAIRAFYKRHGLTPIRNLAALLFLPIMAIALLAVQDAASASRGEFLWIKNFAERDPWLILPILFAALLAFYLHLAFVRTAKHRVLVWAIVFPLLAVTGGLFSAGADIYLVASSALLVAQRACVAGEFSRLRTLWHRLLLGDGIISLDDPLRLANLGNKAHRLAQMRAQGLPVPDGLLLSPRFLHAFTIQSADWRRRHLDRIWRRLGKACLAVRSSASAEDGRRSSFAGVFESVLNVDRAGLEAAIMNVLASFDTARAKSYGKERGDGSILIQAMIDPEFAGVLFTRDPIAGGLSMIELVRGTADGLVSGTVAPQTFRCGRLSGRTIGPAQPPIDLAPLVSVGRRVEEIFGTPQDIEWTYRDGRFHLVQSRDITRFLGELSPAGTLAHENARVLELAAGARPEEIVFAQNELAEMLPRPTPLSLSLMDSLWASGGSVDLACRSLGLEYRVQEDAPNYLVTIFGRIYVDKRQERERAPRIGPLAMGRLFRRADRIERAFREEFLPDFLRDISLREAVDFDRLGTDDLLTTLEQLRDHFVHSTHVEVDIINVAASFYFEQAKAKLTEHGLDPVACLAHMPATAYDCALAETAQAPLGARRAVLAARVGHRAVLDYELAQPRYSEELEMLERLCHHASSARLVRPETIDPVIAAADPNLLGAVRIARRFAVLKEDAKHHTLRELAVLRRAALALDRRLGLDDLVFYLTFDEVAALRERSVEQLRGIAALRRNQATLFAEIAPLPPSLTIVDIEDASAGVEESIKMGDGVVRGTRVSGSRVVEGRARVLTPADAESGCAIPRFADGDIIVSTMIHPAWLPYFDRAGGFVCEIGGWLSHTAILAREYDVPMIVGTRGVRTIVDGSRVRLGLDGTIEVLADDGRAGFSALAAE